MTWVWRTFLLVVCLAIAAPASGSTGPRFKLRPGWTHAQAMRRVEQRFNRTPGFSGARCWMWDGNARLGWRHGTCVGAAVYQGTRFGIRATYTPISCSRQRVVIVVAGLRRQAGTAAWKHDVFLCGR